METKKENYPAKSAPFTVLLYPAEVAAATAKAKEQGQSFSALVRELVANYVKKGGKNEKP